MSTFKDQVTHALFEKNHLSEEQFEAIRAYRGLNLFSVHNELKFLLYFSIVLFTSDTGILIYQNIDTIGHSALIGLLLLMTLPCFYFCFKNHTGFKKKKFFSPIRCMIIWY